MMRRRKVLLLTLSIGVLVVAGVLTYLWRTGRLANFHAFEEAVPVPIDTNATTIDGATLTGKVKLLNGASSSLVTVFIDMPSLQMSYPDMTDEESAAYHDVVSQISQVNVADQTAPFSLFPLPLGKTFVITASDGVSSTRATVTTPAQVGTFNLEKILEIDGSQRLNKGNVTMKILDSAGNIVTNATLSLKSSDGTFDQEARLDSNGKVSFNKLTPGGYLSAVYIEDPEPDSVGFSELDFGADSGFFLGPGENKVLTLKAVE